MNMYHEVTADVIVYRDDNDASTQTMLEVTVSQGPNLRPPVFEQPVYDAEVGSISSVYSCA
jgi:hypothetical protein